jgi:hypothetical protein
MRGIGFLPFLVPTSCASFGLSLAFPFVFCVMVLAMDFFFLGFFWIPQNNEDEQSH